MGFVVDGAGIVPVMRLLPVPLVGTVLVLVLAAGRDTVAPARP
jgi:hypothetical protein